MPPVASLKTQVRDCDRAESRADRDIDIDMQRQRVRASARE